MMDTNKISEQVEGYIAYKQSLGYRIKIEAQELRRFAAYTCKIGYAGSVTHDVTVCWAAQNPNYSLRYKARRLETVHTFAVYASALDAQTQIPQTGIFGKAHGRGTPYIYTETEILRLMAETENLFSPDGIRHRTVSAALGLLWATGIRVSELTELTMEDVRLDAGYIHIRHTKFKKERYVPIRESVMAELTRYAQFVAERVYDRNEGAYFFVSSYGHRFNTRSFEYAFGLIRPCLSSANDVARNVHKCRLYDFRHSFACRTILRWLQNGEDANQKTYLLSVYMGHVKPEDTYWYLSATPDLLNLACGKFERFYGGGAHE